MTASTIPSLMSARRTLLVASSGAFLAFLDATIVNVAFPSIRESFPGTSIGSLSWVLNAYNIVFAAFLVVFGRLSDLLGRRRTFLLGLAVFTAASVLCGLAPSIGLLNAARVLQALGAALLVPASLALVVDAFPAEKRSHAIGLWGAAAAVAAGLGPPLGGALVEVGGWRAAFLVNLPLGLAAVMIARRQLVESRAPGRRRLPDLRGAAVLALCLGVLNLAVVKGNDWGWSSLATLGSFALSGLLLGLFVLSSRRHPSPLVDPLLLRLPSFAMANLATALAGLGFFAYLLTNILWLQYVWDYSVLRAGLALMPGALVAAVVAGLLGPVAEKRGYRAVVVPGAIVWAGAYVWYHQRAGTTPDFLADWLPGQVLSGIGVGATLPVLGSAAMAAVPGGRYATASAIVSSTRQLGGVLGIAVLVVIVGAPTPETVVGALRDGWLLSAAAFVAVAVLSLPLGRLPVRPEIEAGEEADAPQVHLPDQRATESVEMREGRGAGLAGLADVPMFAALSGQARRRLEAEAPTVHVSAGELLIEEGRQADAAYVVQSGRLQVFAGGQFLRELGPGAVLGELALLTGGTRSATVRARRDSTLLQISKPALDSLLDGDPAASRAVMTQLADRLSNPPPTTIPPGARPSVIAVVALHPGAGEAAVAETLATRIRRHARVVMPRQVGAEAVEQAERDGATVLLVAGAEDGKWSDFCLRQADRTVLVADASATPKPLVRPAGSARLAERPDLVLVGRRPSPEELAAWTVNIDPWQVVVVDDSSDAALASLADRMQGRSLGLVLAGGGARAFAHVGVLMELEEAGFLVDRIAGCSIGSIIAATHATGADGQTLYAAAYEEFVRRRPFSDYTLPTASLARGHRTAAGLARTLGSDTVIEGLPRQFHCVSTDLITRSRHIHRQGRLVTAVRCSAGLPVLFPPVPDGQRLLVDGGILDNLPVDLLTERDEGPVVAVNIAMGSRSGSPRPPTGEAPVRAPRVPALGETLLRTMMIGSGGAVAAARARGALVITPAPMGVGLLEFHQLDRMVTAGRVAARALLDATGGDLQGYSGHVGGPAVPVPDLDPAVQAR